MTQWTHRRLGLLLPRIAMLVAGLTAASGAGLLFARPTQPSANDRQITLAVAMLMERQHLTGHRLDDQISERASTQQHFIAITYTINAQSKEQIVALAQALQAVKGVMMLI